ncbi:uncharacterized protein LOC111074183 [Drosophila obscura]|uniref:uncharacterized protein LOC111074183 n=1 Tax=Drosophila obscura TaxID=7282 RepID=UPI001BB1501B|nr:uncharacterized protein LOC111074183 [Drosophila obscura]
MLRNVSFLPISTVHIQKDSTDGCPSSSSKLQSTNTPTSALIPIQQIQRMADLPVRRNSKVQMHQPVHSHPSSRFNGWLSSLFVQTPKYQYTNQCSSQSTISTVQFNSNTQNNIKLANIDSMDSPKSSSPYSKFHTGCRFACASIRAAARALA